MVRLAVLCPTRDGVDGTYRAYTSMLQTSNDTTLIVCADDDQRALYEALGGQRLKFSFGSRGDIVVALNRAIENYPDFDAYGLIVDDARFTVPGWDVHVFRTLEGFPGRIGVVSAAHTLGVFVNFGYVSRRWVETLGWYACPDTAHYCWDTVLELLGEATAIDYAPKDKFFIQHDHVHKDKTLPVFIKDTVQFLGWCVNGRRDQVARLREASR